MSGRRILMTAATVGSVWSYSRDLAGRLAADGDRVLIAAMGGRANALQRREIEVQPGVYLADSDHPLEWMQASWDAIDESCDWLRGLATEFEPDLIHCNTYVHAAMPWSQPVLLVTHRCVCSWFEAVHRRAPPSPEWDEYRRRVAAGVAAADLLVAPTSSMLEACTRHHPVGAERCVIPHGAVPERHRHHEGGRTILAAGRAWDQAKNLELLAAIGPKLPWPVAVAGATRAPDGSEHRLAGLRQLGWLGREQLATAMARAGIFAHPARYEPFGLAVLEAAFSGCALVLADLPSLRELWQDAAIFIDPDDPAEWLRQLTRVCRSASTRQRLARAAYRRARALDIECCAAAYRGCYRQLLVEHTAVPAA